MPTSSLISRSALIVLLASVALAPARTSAQATAIRSVRTVLAPWDREGTETLDAMRELTRTARSAPTPEARLEARYLRASIAIDLLIASQLGAERAIPVARIADTLGVAEPELEPHLRSELGAVVSSVAYRDPAREALSALDLRAAMARGDREIDWSRHQGSRRDLLLVATATEALGISGDPAQLPAFAPEPCATATPSTPCSAPWTSLAPASRRELASMLEVSRALKRIGDRARAGDPLSRALQDRVALATARLETTTLHAIPRLERDRDLLGGEDGEPVRASVIVLVRRREVRVASMPPLRVRDGEIVLPADAGRVLPESDSVRLPWRFAGPPAAITEVARAVGAHRPDRRTVAVAVAPRVRADVLARVLVSVAEIARGPIALVRRGADGTLRGAPITIVMHDRDVSRRDLVVNVDSGRYALARRQRRITLRLPDVRPQSGIGFGHLDSLIQRLPHQRVVVGARPDVPARDLLDVAFRAIVAHDTLAVRVR
ncbi:hypothetical protein [Sandaracinus amylolyticus]|uniref:Uncharacterized protein n=1 Tax=Sandaracinus amylolyticus TaxID=927083 RepID=A0A0F6YFD3_9BACT|nr:hypothetical protein [Sandaracinus amylolyticus]AKF03485.1 hypothetical protein DB32_000634 [Sandaracinus amylolyticus]